MYYKIVLFVFFSLSTTAIQAQWTKSDSLNLDRLLKGNKEININKHELKNIHFNNDIINNPYIKPIQSNNLQIDETLPESKKKTVLKLLPYNPNTPYNWDPIFHCKMIQVNEHWEPVKATPHFTDQSRAIEISIRTTDEITKMMKLKGIRIGHGNTYINGGTISGLDLMFIFEKRFWNKIGNERRERTLELLKHYNDPLPRIPKGKK